MTLNIELTPQAEAWIKDRACRCGKSPSRVVEELVEEHVPPAAVESQSHIDPENAAAIALLDAWIKEGESADAETRRLADLEVEELKRNMNANRAATGERLVFP